VTGRRIVVAGSSSRAGKTALAETVLRAFPSPAVKFTTTDDVFESCPRGTTCIVCDIDVPFRIVRDGSTLREEGTDTARLLDAAGGHAVLWTIARRSSAEVAWRATERALAEAGRDASPPRVRPVVSPDLVVEGSTVSSLCDPTFVFFVVHPFLKPGRWKDGTRELIGRSDCVVLNRPANETRAPGDEVIAAVRDARPRDLRIADVAAPLASWAGDLVSRLEAARA
jgi:hypothetical protein